MTTPEPNWEKLTNEHDQLGVELWYPRSRKAQSIRVSLYDVRAADDLVIEFDFDRDGWVIRMDETSDDLSGIIKVIREEVEVAFIPAWNEVSETTTSTQ